MEEHVSRIVDLSRAHFMPRMAKGRVIHEKDIHSGSGQVIAATKPANDEPTVNYGRSAELSLGSLGHIAPQIVEMG